MVRHNNISQQIPNIDKQIYKHGSVRHVNQQPSSDPPVALWVQWVASGQRGPASTSNSVALVGQPSLCHWRRQCGSIKLAIGCQNQWGGKSGGTEEEASEASLVAHFASHVCAMQWLRGGWPPQGGWPLLRLWRHGGAMYVCRGVPSIDLHGREAVGGWDDPFVTDDGAATDVLALDL